MCKLALGLLSALNKSFTGEAPHVEPVNVNMILSDVLWFKKGIQGLM